MPVSARTPLHLALLALVFLTPLAAAQDPVAYAADAVAGAAADPAGFAKGRVDDPGRDAAFVLCLAHRVTGVTPDACPLPPAPSDEPAAEPDPVDPVPEPAGAAQDVADEAREAVDRVVEDPASAPDALAGLVASLRQFVTDLLGLPIAAVDGASGLARGAADGAFAALDGFAGAGREARDATLDAFEGAAAAAKGALAGGADAASSGARVAFDAVKGAVDVVKALLAPARDAAPVPPARDLAPLGPEAREAKGLLDGALGLLG